MEEGIFREDLFYRLAVVRIEIPPLRERPEDIPGLVRHLLRRHTVRAAVPVPVVTPEAMRALCQSPWRGNVRELSNVLERALILADAGRIDLDAVSASRAPRAVRAERAGALEAGEELTRFSSCCSPNGSHG